MLTMRQMQQRNPAAKVAAALSYAHGCRSGRTPAIACALENTSLFVDPALPGP